MGGRHVYSINDRQRTIDALTLAFIVALSAAPYIARLGFYSDDWSLLASFKTAAVSGRSVIATTLPNYGVRPVQGVYLALLYEAFGFRPLGYHLVNMAVIAASDVLLYLLLLRLHLNRSQAFAAALIFVLMPQLTTVRVWFAAFQIPLSMLFALIAMHAQMTFDQTRKGYWLLIAVSSAAISIGAYEIFAPMVAGFAVTSWVWGGSRRSATAIVGPAAMLAVTAFGVAYKFLTERSGELADPNNPVQFIRVFLSPHYDWRFGYGLNAIAATEVYFWHSLRDWGVAMGRLVTGRVDVTVIAASVAIGTLAWWRLREAEAEPQGPPWRLLVIGLAAFVLGHATFLVANSIMFAPTGIGNRVLVAGAIGAAIILVALVAFAARTTDRYLHRSMFAIFLGVVAAAAVVRLEFVEEYWAEAPKLEREVLRPARADLAAVPAGSTVILDGVCPYHGPSIIFETYWDTGAALSLLLDRTIYADAVSPRMMMSPSGLETEIYGEPARYRFGPKLFIYDPRRHLVVRLADAVQARSYFSNPGRPRMRCPAGYVGQGVLV